MEMTVWLVNPFDNTPMEGYRPQRYWLMARAFVRAGFKVVYWTSDFSHATKRRREFVRENEEPIDVRLVPSMPYGRNVSLRRVFSHLALARRWRGMAEREASASVRPQLIIASAPPLGLCDAARSFARDCGAMFVADIQDAWPETFERVLPGFVFSLLGMRRTARRIYCESDAVSAVAMRYIDLAQSYGGAVPMMVFGHCIEMARPIPARQAAGAGTLRLVYIGNMSLSYDLETAVKAVSGVDGVTLDIAGDGPDRERLEALATSLHAANITFHGYLGEKELASLLRSCDAGLIPMFPASCVGVPGKLADYAAAGLKVIESLGGETTAIVNRHSAGTHYEAGNVESLRKAIEAVRSLGVGNPSAIAMEFDATRVMDGYVEWINGLLQCRKDWGSVRGPHYDRVDGVGGGGQ